MQLTTVCKICGDNLADTWHQDRWPDPIHPTCDTRPAAQRHTPHPALGKVAALAHDTTLAMAAASTTPDGSPQWDNFDQLADQLRQAQEAERHLPLPVAAMAYAVELGWPVFPLHPGRKTPLTRNGFKDATTSPGQVHEWWEQHPDANIGLPTGIYFDVIDVDTPISLNAWDEISEEPDLEVHGFAYTSSGGYHAYIAPIPADGPKNRAGAFGPGVDFRTTGGYVVAPWSHTSSGEYWQWVSFPSHSIRAPHLRKEG